MVSEWVLLAAFAGIASNIFNFFNRYFLKDRGDATAWAWTFETMRLLVFIVLALFDWHLIWSAKTLWLLLGLGLSEFLAVYFYMQMHKYSHLSLSTIISRTRLVWVAIIAFFFLHEQLAMIEYIGIGILFLGLSIVVAPHKLFVDKGAIAANIAAVLIAINSVILKEAVPYASGSVLMIAMSLPSVILFPLFVKQSRKRFLLSFPQHLPLKLLAIIAHVFSAYLLIFALHTGNVSNVNAIYQGMMITSVLAGIFLLGEKKDIGKKLLGTVVSIVGIILLTQ